MKQWILVYALISVVQNFRYYINKRIDMLYIRGYISYRCTSIIRFTLVLMHEVIHAIWQIYGNFIYYEWRGKTPTDDSAFQKCMDDKNNGYEIAMFLCLMIGYLFFLIYLLVILLVCCVLATRLRSR